MIFRPSEFKLSDRGFKETIVLIPGWATDYRILAALDLNYNYLFPVHFQPTSFKNDLSKFLDGQGLRKISLLGWSSGGFLAADFASHHPESVGELILLSIRDKYPVKTLEKIKECVKKNKKAYLYKFYLECFSHGESEEFTLFKKGLLKDYMDMMATEDLIGGLEYLSQARINARSLQGVKRIRFFHGEEDKIAPLKEALKVKSQISQADFVIFPKTGHMPFLNQHFREKISLIR